MIVGQQSTLSSSQIARQRAAQADDSNPTLAGNAPPLQVQTSTQPRPIEPSKPASEQAIRDLTGNPDASAYDQNVAGVAVRDGITYNKAVENINTTNIKLGIPERETSVHEMPWETEAINVRVDDLMSQDGLSFEAAVVVAMTDRPKEQSGDFWSNLINNIKEIVSPTTPVEEGWEENFASMVSGSAAELEAWAVGQPDSALATFGDTGTPITVSMADGQVVISDGATVYVFNAADFDRIVIVGGSGDDRITVKEDVVIDLTIVGGAGDDTIVGGNGSNLIFGGDGNDNLEGGAKGDLIIGGQGRDSVYGAGGDDIIFGGTGDDALYGGGGEDFIIGGNGDDYSDGGRGDDVLRGGAGADTLSGGFGRDILRGETGADTLIGASGRDNYADAMLGDTVIAENDEDVEANGAIVKRIEVDNGAGSDAVSIASGSRDRFTDRVEDDLQTLRSLNSGQAMLNALDDEFDRAGHTTVVEEYDTENGAARKGGENAWMQADGSRGSGESGTIFYNPHYNAGSGSTPKVPIAVLFHEFAHTYDYATGQLLRGTYDIPDPVDPAELPDPNSGTRLRELQAAGIAIDHDLDTSTPDQLPNEAGHAFELTENGLRDELGLPTRTVY